MKNNKEVVLSVKDLKVNFSTDHGYVQAVRGVSFDLYKGETLCIVGESGSGKSVTSKTIMGILASNGRIVNGSIMYQGEDLTKVSEDEFHRIRGHKIGMIFQDPLSSLNPIVRIGKQITEAMLVNSSRTKRLFDEKVAPELVAYKNAETELHTGLNRQKELLKFYEAEKKKEITKAKNHASNEKQSRLYTLKQNYGASVFAVKTDASLSVQEKNEKIHELDKEYKENIKKAKQFAAELKKSSKENVTKVKAEYDAKISELKNSEKGTSEELKAKYIPLIKENKEKYKARCKEAKKEVKQYKKDVKASYNADVKQIKKSDSPTKKADIKERKRQYVASLKITKHEAKQRALKIMKEVGISNPEKRFRQYPFEFSGGMRQRIVIAIALTADPDILICDEPTTALDVTIQAQILELINRLKRERNLSCIFITHDLGVVANMADRVAVMYAGKIVEYGTEAEIFYDPRHPYTWALLSSIPDVDSKERLEAIPGTPPNMIYPPVGDAFALRSKYAMAIDFKKEPPLFKVSETHFAATWLLDPRAPKVEMPKIVATRIANSLKAAKAAGVKVNYKGSDVALPVEQETKPVVQETVVEETPVEKVEKDVAVQEEKTVLDALPKYARREIEEAKQEHAREQEELEKKREDNRKLAEISKELNGFKKRVPEQKLSSEDLPSILKNNLCFKKADDIALFKAKESHESVQNDAGYEIVNIQVVRTLAGEYRVLRDGKILACRMSVEGVNSFIYEYANKNQVEIHVEKKGDIQ